MKNYALLIFLLLASALTVAAQGPPNRGARGPRPSAFPERPPGDPAAVEAGKSIYGVQCAFCHGSDARGGEGGPNLLRSDLVLNDKNGELIAPVIQNGRVDQGMPKFALSMPQIQNVAAFIHSFRVGGYDASRLTPPSIVVGDAKAGEAYFNGAGGCGSCHSPTGDLAHVASKYAGAALQNRWLYPSGGRGAGGAQQATVTRPSGETLTGRIKQIDDFDVSIVDASGAYHSWPRSRVTVEVADPLKRHRELLGRYTDADVHNVTAYLATLK